jgi:hypothetical protein
MNKNYYLLLFFLTTFFVKSQTILFSADFNANNNGFNVINGNGGDNQWQIDNIYYGGGFLGDTPNQPATIAGFPQSNYMHINSVGVGCGLLGACNAVYDTSSPSDTSITTLAPIVTTGSTNVKLSFWYLCGGAPSNSYGIVEYQIGGAGAWTQVGAQLQGKSVWTFLTLADPAFSNQAQLRLRFHWINGSLGVDPAFSVDDVKVFTPAAASAVKLFSLVNPTPIFYDTLKEAFDAINAGNYQGTVSIEIYGDTTETAKATLNASGTGLTSYTSLSIKPIGGIKIISGNFASELIGFNGADNVTIDGNIAGVNSLVISNTNISATSGTSTIRFYTDATNNVVTNCNVLGSATMLVGTNGGNFWFAAGAVTSGNDNNTISNCNIGPAGGNSPSKGVYFSGTLTTLAQNNSGNMITNNNFIDVFSVNTSSAGVYSTTGSTANIITNNKFYQTTPKTFTLGQTHSAINITNTSTAENFTITGNIIGYSSNLGTGNYVLNANSFAPKFYGIYFNGKNAGISSNISNNTISNISLTGGISSGSGNTNPFSAIYLEKGVITSNNNIIGSQTATGSLIFSTSSTSATDVFGMFNNAANDSWTANNNSIGGITANHGGATGQFIVYGIRTSAGVAATCTAQNNLIGGTVANSIQNNSLAPTSQLIGFVTTSSALNATSNLIRNLTTTSPNINGTTTASLIGILVNNSGSTHSLSKNNIFNLVNTNTIAQTVVNGIVFSGNTSAGTSNTVEKNQIYNLTSATNNALAQVNGILASNGNTTYKNNFISLGANVNNAIEISGINEFLGTNNFWHNSIYIFGSPTSGTTRSFAFNASQVSNTRSFRNNIFWNARNNSGTASGKNYIVRVGGSSINPTGLTVNNNVYYGTGSGSVFGFFNNIDVPNLASWQIAVGQDANSQVTNPSYLDPTNAIPDLHIPASTCNNPRPTTTFIAVTDDIDDNIRSTTSPNIGADENNIPTFTWSGTWSPVGTPDIGSIVNFNSSYDMTSLPNIDACSVNINNVGTVVKVTSNKYLNIQNDLKINSGAILNVENNGSVVMINDSGVVTNSGSGIANVTRNTTPYERYDYTYWSAPVLNPTIGSSLSAWRQNYSFEFNAANFLDLYSGQGFPQIVGSPDTFDDNDDDWIPVLQTTPMLPAKGYAIMENASGPFPITTPVTFSGKLNNGSITIPMQLSPGIIDPNDDLNLVGNPYPSAISANNFINANFPNISGTLYFWTHKADVSISNPGPDVYNFTNDDYAYYNLSGGIATAFTTGSGSITGSAAPSGFIASGQGFFVDAQIATNLVFNNSMRSKTFDNSNFWRPNTLNQNDKIWINLTNNDGLFSQQLIGYFDNATLNKDQAFDAEVLKGPSNLNFYSISQTENFKIQARPTFNDNDMVPIGFSTTSNGNFTIAIDHQEGVFNNQNVYLQDNLLNIVHDLKQAPYSFYTSFGTFNDRFILKYNNLTLSNNIFDEDLNEIKISLKDSQINILSSNQNFQSIQIFDILGRNIFEKQTINNKFFQINNLSIKNQTLIIKTKLENGKTITRKVIF